MYYILDKVDSMTYSVLDTDDGAIDNIGVSEIGEFIASGVEIKGVSFSKNGDLKITPLSVTYPCLQPYTNEVTGGVFLKYCIDDIETFVREMKSLFLSKEAIRDNAVKYGFDEDYVMQFFK